MHSADSAGIGKEMGAGSVSTTAPNIAEISELAGPDRTPDSFLTKVWKFYTNRIEILVLNALISSPKIKVGLFEPIWEVRFRLFCGLRLPRQVDAFDNRRRTALLYAARYGRTFAVSRLLDARANIGFADRAAQFSFFLVI